MSDKTAPSGGQEFQGGMRGGKIDVSGQRDMHIPYDKVEFSDGKGYTRHGSPTFYALLERMAEIHDRKSHDYASNDNPYGNYHFAGMLSKLFNNPDDAGFIGRIGEKLFRLANIENTGKIPKNETIEDTEIDICTIIALWIADRQDRRSKVINERSVQQQFPQDPLPTRPKGGGV